MEQEKKTDGTGLAAPAEKPATQPVPTMTRPMDDFNIPSKSPAFAEPHREAEPPKPAEPVEAPAPQPAAAPQKSAPKKAASSASTAKKPKSSGAKSGSKASSKKSATARSRSNSSKEETDRIHFTTATDNKSPKRNEAKKQATDSCMPRSAKPAHRAMPYVLFILALFTGICLILNLFCNRENALAADPSGHWMGTVGYWICYWLFGLFGPAAFVLPLLIVNLSVYWKKYIDNRLTISKMVASLAFMILLGALIHIFCLSMWDAATRFLSAKQLIELGSHMTMGGLIGGGTGYFLAKYLNITGAVILGVCLLIAALFYFLGMTPHHLWSFLRERRRAKREGRGTVSEQDAEAAGYDAKMKERMKKTLAKNGDSDTDPNTVPEGAVIRKAQPDAPTSKHASKEARRDRDDRLAPMPIPMLDPNEGKLFVPADINRKLSEANGTPAPAKKEPEAPAAPIAPANPAANKDTAIEPIFPKTEAASRPVPKSERNFDLKNVFIEFEGMKSDPRQHHTPVPPEVPMTGTRPAASRPAAKPATAPAPAVKTAAAASTAPQAAPVKPKVAPTAAPAAKAPQKPTLKPTVREVKDLEKKDFGLSNEEFEKIEAQHQTPAKAGAKPAAKATADAKKPAAPAGVVSTPVPQKPKRYVFPPLTYLHEPEPMSEENKDEIKASVNNLYETLQNFRINILGITYSYGPTVTRYELTPAPGVRVRSIVNLADDISLVFASKVRIEAPIPGKSAVGIEVPNKNRTKVYLRELLESKAFTDAPSKLTACLGSDVTGKPLFFNIAKMPHLLVAGATGMGKSVCINSIIMSLLYKARPDEVKLVLIDPKKVEFSIYKGIPHLLAPIVTAPKDAAGALQAAVEEMENRFELIQQVGAKDIKGYNEITKNDPDMPFMPQIVIIIDELADLMMTAPDEVETAICRLAQKARAAGMHIIIGTQRPSVDVVTGLIKSNIPSRIAFTVASQVDSRTILDVSGAEKLIGYGDMLFAPVGDMGFTRVQGAFVDEKEVENICEFIRATNGTAVYDERFTSKMKELSAQCGNKNKGGADSAPLPDGGAKGDDAKYSDAVRIAVEEKKISTSLLQRKLEIGYSRAAKLIDRMQAEGIVSAPDGSKPRAILITPEEYIEKFIDVPTEE